MFSLPILHKIALPPSSSFRLRPLAASRLPSSFSVGFSARCLVDVLSSNLSSDHPSLVYLFTCNHIQHETAQVHDGHHATDKATISPTSETEHDKCSGTADHDASLAVRAFDLTLPASLQRGYHPSRCNIHRALVLHRCESEAAQSADWKLELRWNGDHCPGSRLRLLGRQTRAGYEKVQRQGRPTVS